MAVSYQLRDHTMHDMISCGAQGLIHIWTPSKNQPTFNLNPPWIAHTARMTMSPNYRENNMLHV